MKKSKVLAIIPARGGSKRIKNKNLRFFAGEPLIARTIRQARMVKFADRIVVDTDSSQIASIAKKCGAEVPFLRPAHLAADTSQITVSVLHLLERLAQEGYRPDYVLILQTTSPLRELKDIETAWKRIKKGNCTSVVTVAPTHPQLYHLSSRGTLVLANKKAAHSSNTQAWPEGFVLNGCFVYLVKVAALKKERRLITRKTEAVVCPRWRSVDLDTPEDWVMAELVEQHAKKIARKIERFK